MAAIALGDSTRTLEPVSNNAFSIHIPGVIWIVETGRIDLFVTRVAEREFGGARRPFISVEAGQAIFGMSSGSCGCEFAILANPTPGTTFRCSFLGDLRADGGRSNETEDSSALLENWISSLTRATGTNPFPNDVVELSPGAVLEVTGQAKPFVSEDGLLWVQHVRGSSRFLNHPATSPIIYGEFFPLSRPAWLQPEPGSHIRVLDVREWSECDLERQGLHNFHRTVLEWLSFEQGLLRDQERKDLLNQSGSDAAAFRGALQSLAAPLLQPDEYTATFWDRDGRQPLIQVCEMIGKALGAKMVYPLELIHGHKWKDSIIAIAKASGLRSRVVALKGKWWKDGNTTLVAFRGDDSSPVALLPADSKGYELFDPIDLSTTKVSAAVAPTLNGFAHCFYRPLPDGKLSAAALLSYGLRGSQRELLTILLMGMGSGLLSLVVPVATGVLFNSIIPGAQRSQLLLMAAFLFMATLATATFFLTRSLAILRLEGKLGSTLQAALWDRLLRLPVPFFRGFSSGDLAERSLGIEYILRMLTGSALSTILSGLFSFFSFLLLFYYSWQLAWVAGVLTLVALSVSMATTYLQVRNQRALLKLQGKISGMLLGFVDSIAKLRVSGSEPRLFAVWAREFAAQKILSVKARRASNGLAVFDSAFPVISLAVIFSFAARLMDQPLLRSLSTGSFLAFMVAFVQFQTATLQLSKTVESVIGIVPLYERAAPIFAAQPETRSASKNPGVLTGWIEINHLNFHYPQAAPTVLRDVSISIKPGQFVAVVGHSGSGKSTLLRLLLGFEKPDSGAIYFDGQDLAGLDIEAVRRQMGVVIQSARLVQDSIFRNIAGSSPLTFDDAWEAARLAGLEEDIRQMPMGLHTVVSEGGGNLSGGQRQRLMIARAMAKKPRIFIFDEATSALDNVTQARVTRSLDAFQATRIVVAHRLSTIVNADRIFVLEKGVVTQFGSYNQLLKEEGLFRDLATRQLT
jgi:NHLM bacteriocin system ABC transporter ATP-binding protein